jgi:hypothetical protein
MDDERLEIITIFSLNDVYKPGLWRLKKARPGQCPELTSRKLWALWQADSGFENQWTFQSLVRDDGW